MSRLSTVGAAPTIRISLIIPTRDRPGPLAACLMAVADGYPSDAETIVVSDGGRVDLQPVVAPFVEGLRLRLVVVEPGGPAAARNRGLETAAGEIVAFTDDDCRPVPGWLAMIADGVASAVSTPATSSAPPRAVGGSTSNGLPDSPCADAAQLVLDLLSRHDRALAHRERFLPSNNIAFPAAPLARLGGFDESFRTAEDRELCRRWAEAGFLLSRVPAAWVEHDAQLGLAGFVSKFFTYGRGAARFHGSGHNPSLGESSSFHLRLPLLLWPELRRRGVVRGTAIVVLLVLWELANVAGFVIESAGGRLRAPATKAARPSSVLLGRDQV